LAHLFISYSTRDGRPIAFDLCAALEWAGHTCWLAPRDVRPGVTYPGQIVAAIRESAGLILVVTPAANESADVLQEVQLAGQHRKTVAPVIVDDTKLCDDLHYYLAVRQQLSWSDAVTTVTELLRSFPAPDRLGQDRTAGSRTTIAGWSPLPDNAEAERLPRLGVVGREGRAHRLLRELGLEIVADGPGRRYPRAVPGPAEGYRYWATYLEARKTILLGAQKLSGELDVLELVRLKAAGFMTRRNLREVYVELGDDLTDDLVAKAVTAANQLAELLHASQSECSR
jgi:hypothetical protein